MKELVDYCDARDAGGSYFNDADRRQARVFRSYIIASLLGVDFTVTVDFTNAQGIWYRQASFS